LEPHELPLGSAELRQLLTPTIAARGSDQSHGEAPEARIDSWFAVARYRTR
jgi:hypothetical protein